MIDCEFEDRKFEELIAPIFTGHSRLYIEFIPNVLEYHENIKNIDEI